MSKSDHQPRLRGSSTKPCLQDKVGQFYYALGLICSSYPVTVITFAIAVCLVCCYPLIHLPLPGTAPTQTWTSSQNITSVKEPYCYVQQVVIRISVLPWEPDLTLGDAFRAPIYEAFKLLEVVRNYEDPHSLKSLGHVCLHVEATKRPKYQDVLPQYSCLVLSPANLWQQDVQQFSQDESLLATIFNHHSLQKGKPSISEMLFGMHMLDSGIKRYPFRVRPRVIQYSVTLFFKEYDKEFVAGLGEKLQSLYPLYKNFNSTSMNSNDTLLIQYPGEINYLEFVPITACFIAMFLYYYFFVRKIEIIKSKFGMACTVFVTVFGSLAMTLGVCFFFGLTLTLQGKEIFPYLVALVGLENVFVITKSVVSMPLHLDVKIRLAQGLSKEGWSITKNLLLELTILTFGLFTFVPVIQEFCIFVIVGLITDYFMQMFFFSTVLSVDIRRMESQVEKMYPTFRSNLYQNLAFYDKSPLYSKPGLNRSKSHPRLNSYPANVIAGQAQGAQTKKIPKRVLLVNMWARTRFFQRSFMILMVVWIFIIAYNSGIIEHYILNSTMFKDVDESIKTIPQREQNYPSIKIYSLLNNNSLLKQNYVTQKPLRMEFPENNTADWDSLKHPDYAPWLKLSLQHWSSIFNKYNLSLSGQTLAILPDIRLSHVIRPEQAVLMRNPNEKYGDKFQWHTLAAALDPLEFHSVSPAGKISVPQSEQPFYPTSPMEIMLTTILCFISVVVLAYAFVVLYRCICSRNYAEWRASWFSEKSEESGDDHVLLEAVPVVVDAHKQPIECLVTDGASLVSICLSGYVKVWDNVTGELLSTIDRRKYFSNNEVKTDNKNDTSDSLSDGSNSPEAILNMPKYFPEINTSFSNIKQDSDPSLDNSQYDFARAYHQVNLNCVRNRSNGLKQNHRATYDVGKNSAECNQKSSLCETQLTDCNRHKKLSESSVSGSSNSNTSLNREFSDSANRKLSSIWCVDYVDNLIVLGCANGHLEFWEATTGQLKCLYEDGIDAGVTHLKIIGSRVVAARLLGTIEFLQLQTYNNGRPVDWNFTCAYRRTHIRTGSVGSANEHNNLLKQNMSEESLECTKVITVKAHQQPITCMDSEGGYVITGSQDHTLKVFNLEDGGALYTLHGHCGPITYVFIDRVCPSTSGSGSQDGMLCVWDLLTGACMYNIQAHNAPIISLTYSASYVISLGMDDRLCVWERFQGHLLTTVPSPHSFSSQVLMLSPNLIVSARDGCLVVWDVRSGDCIRTISLGGASCVLMKQMLLTGDTVVCDYGSKLARVRFPIITHKCD